MWSEDFGRVWSCMTVLCFTLVPLGIWKLIEIIIWLVKHVSISW